MSGELAELLEESTQLELSIARLYRFFHQTFAEDTEFWRQLYVEEGNHAALIRSAGEILLVHGRFPPELLAPTLEGVAETGIRVRRLLREYADAPPTREVALATALALERSAGEAHYQEAMAGAASSDALDLLRRLNGHDRDHADRILAYAREQGLVLDTAADA